MKTTPLYILNITYNKTFGPLKIANFKTLYFSSLDDAVNAASRLENRGCRVVNSLSVVYDNALDAMKSIDPWLDICDDERSLQTNFY